MPPEIEEADTEWKIRKELLKNCSIELQEKGEEELARLLDDLLDCCGKIESIVQQHQDLLKSNLIKTWFHCLEKFLEDSLELPNISKKRATLQDLVDKGADVYTCSLFATAEYADGVGEKELLFGSTSVVGTVETNSFYSSPPTGKLHRRHPYHSTDANPPPVASTTGKNDTSRKSREKTYKNVRKLSKQRKHWNNKFSKQCRALKMCRQNIFKNVSDKGIYKSPEMHDCFSRIIDFTKKVDKVEGNGRDCCPLHLVADYAKQYVEGWRSNSVDFSKDNKVKGNCNDRWALHLMADYAKQYVECWRSNFGENMKLKMEETGASVAAQLADMLEKAYDQVKLPSVESNFRGIVEDFRRYTQEMNDLLKALIPSENTAALDLILLLQRKVETDCRYISSILNKRNPEEVEGIQTSKIEPRGSSSSQVPAAMEGQQSSYSIEHQLRNKRLSSILKSLSKASSSSASRLRSICMEGMKEAAKVDHQLVFAGAKIIRDLTYGLPIASKIATIISFLLKTASANFQSTEKMKEIQNYAGELENNFQKLISDWGEWEQWAHEEILLKLYTEAYKLSTSRQSCPMVYRIISAQPIDIELDSLVATLKHLDLAVKTRIENKVMHIVQEDATTITNTVTHVREHLTTMVARQGKPCTTMLTLTASENEILIGKDEILEFLNIGKPGIRVLCIVGIGGVGKTTLLDTLRNRIIKEVNPATTKVEIGKNPNNLLQLQANILSKLKDENEVLEDENEVLADAKQGKDRLQTCFKILKEQNRSLCLCVDNAWSDAHLRELFQDSMYENLPSSTYLLLATRSCLVAEGFMSIFSRKKTEGMVYNLKKLPQDRAEKLFRQIGERPGESLNDELVKEIVKLCDGLPLALRVYATHFKSHASKRRRWKKVAELIKTTRDSLSNLDSDDEIFSILGASIEFQKAEVKEAFIDAVLFWRGKPYQHARYALLGSDGLESCLDCLRKESIIEETEDSMVSCHDLFIPIARKHAYDRRWTYLIGSQPMPQFIDEFQFGKVRGICLLNSEAKLPCNIEKVLENAILPNLSFIQLSTSDLCGTILLKTRSHNLTAVVIATKGKDMRIELQHLQSYRKLRILGLSELTTLPESIGVLPSLQLLDLRGCSSLFALPESIGCLASLRLLDLRGCSSLSALPQSVGRLASLRSLDLRGCSTLCILPESVGSLASLQSLKLSGCNSLSALPESIGGLAYLQSLDLSGCRSLSALPESVGGLVSLQSLNLRKCRALSTLPESIGGLVYLQSLDLRECRSLSTLPESISSLTYLQSLDLRGCYSVSALPESISRLAFPQSLDLSGCCSLSALPESIGRLASPQSLDLRGCSSLSAIPEFIGRLASLQSIDLRGCGSLSALPESIGCLTSLQSLHLGWCCSLFALPESIGRLASLQSLDLNGCTSLSALPESIGCIASLQLLDLSWCCSLSALPDLGWCCSLPTLPESPLFESIGELASLESLDLSGCTSLSALPESIDRLTSLQSLHLSECTSLSVLPESIGCLASLQSLHLRGCGSLSALPESIGRLPSLQSLDLNMCRSMSALPESIGRLASLQSLHLSECTSLSTLPESIGQLPSLQSLDLSRCRSLSVLPESIGHLASLQSLHLSECTSLSTLPESIGHLASLQSLHLSECTSLSVLPESIGCLASLQSLDLRGCSSLSALPESIGRLPSLQSLDLSRCRSMSALPESIGRLASLQSLDLRWCRSLSALPESMGCLASLQSLDLRWCRSLSALPESMGCLVSLQSLDLRWCLSLSTLPESIDRLASLQSLNLLK